jgi:ankyrin repeat protein
MIGLGAALDFADDGDPLIHRCLAREGSDRHAILAALVTAGIDVNARGAGGRTPLHVAAVEADLAAVDLLLAAGANPALRTPTDARATAEEAARTLGHTASADLIAARAGRG